MRDEQVGSYRITQKLAQGGMGEVYLAQHELMDREAVVKVLHPKLLHDEEVVARFLNEARAAASIDHPGIVSIYDLGRAGGQVYIVMERLRGETLAERISREPLAVEQAVAMTRQLASALAAAHELNIVHRDLKPENIFVVPDPDMPGGERIKILDFGVAKLAPSQGGAGMTAQGSIFGTPAYMAPEQCENAAKVDQRTDLYALGCIMYEMLCGRPPFGKGGLELLAAHLRDQPPRPSGFNPQIPEDLERTILQLLAKKPQHRFQSCEELLRALGVANLAPRTSQVMQAPVENLALAATVLPNSQPSIPIPPGVANDFATNPPTSTGRMADGDRAYNVVALSPTTHRHATGQVDGTAPVRRPRRTWPWMALAVVVAGAGAAAFMMTKAEPDDSAAVAPDREAEDVLLEPDEVSAEEALLAQAEKAIDAMQWVDAMAAAQQVVAMAPSGSEAHDRAEKIKELARQGQTYAVTYETFLSAVKKKDVHTAVYLREQLPADSVFRDKSSEAYDAMRAEWMAPKLERARDLAARGQCSKLESIAKDVGYLFPESLAELNEIDEACRNKKVAAAAPGDDKQGEAEKAGDASSGTGSGTGSGDAAGSGDSAGSGDAAGGQGQGQGQGSGDAKSTEPGDKSGDDTSANDKAGEDNKAEGEQAALAEKEALANLPDKVPEDEIRKKMRPVHKDLMKCYQEANLKGRVLVNFKISISAPGKAGLVQSNPEEAGEPFRRCVWDTLRHIDFSQARNMTEVSYPLGRDARKRSKKKRSRRR